MEPLQFRDYWDTPQDWLDIGRCLEPQEPYNGPEWPTYRMYVHPQSPETAGRRVQLVCYESPEDEVGMTVGRYPDPPTARLASVHHREFGWPPLQP